MSSIGFGKLIEDLKYQSLYLASNVTTAATLFNSVASGVTGSALDTQGYDEVNFYLSAGAFTGDGSLAVSIFENDADLPSGASAISGADFTTVTTSNDETAQIGSVRCDSYERYLWARTVKTGTGSANFAIVAIMGKGGEHPETQSPVPIFDVGASSSV